MSTACEAAPIIVITRRVRIDSSCAHDAFLLWMFLRRRF